MRRFTKRLLSVASSAVLCLSMLAVNANFANAASYRPVKDTKTGLVMSTNALANEVGKKVLDKGGNAIDAAVAVGYMLAVVHPSAGNIGGGGFAVIHTADGKILLLILEKWHLLQRQEICILTRTKILLKV